MDISSTGIGAMNAQKWKEHTLHDLTEKKDQIDAVAREFEGVLIRQFLDEALKPMDEENGLFGGKISPMYDQMIKDTLASSITQQSSLGFSSVLQAKVHSDAENPTKPVEKAKNE